MSQILLSGATSRTGTTAYFFSRVPWPGLTNQSDGYVVFNQQSGQPSEIGTYSGDTIWVRNGDNHFVDIDDSGLLYLTGYTSVQTHSEVLTTSEKQTLLEGARRRVSATTQQAVYALFEDTLIDDLFYNVSLTQNFDTLDTFNVYNNVLNSMPIQASDTGVVFGKLEAIQKLINPLSSTEERVKIPLRNVPIGFFRSSEEFPQTTSVDENGNRLRFNFKELASTPLEDTDYFNKESFDFDDQFLLDNEDYSRIPEQYKMITRTNRNGEFVIHNVPVGEQILVFEVDLLKQGLTKEEVALNFFPYPTSDRPNIDTVPHFFYRQIPINVVPAWGELQTGYTEANISVNLDLRKWATYFFVPSNYGGTRLPALPLGPMSIAVRDMTKPERGGGYDTNNLLPSEIVTVPDTLDREFTQEQSWFGEFIQRKDKATFRIDDYCVIKLPANIYHPTMFNSAQTGRNIKRPEDPIVPKTNPIPGTWFASYQFKQFITGQNFRATGAEERGFEGNLSFRNHFDLTFPLYNNTVPVSQGEDAAEIAEANDTLNSPLYNQPWSYFFPNEVKIPSVPNVRLPGNGNATTPRFADGDLIGRTEDESDDEKSGGYGLQEREEPTNTNKFPNKFAQRVTRNYLYKYEQGDFWDERYGAGYRNSTAIPGVRPSRVINGERYQRVECGFSYFMRPNDWAPVVHGTAQDYIAPANIGLSDRNYEIAEANQDLTLTLDQVAPDRSGRLDIYRILDPSPTNILAPDPAVTPTFFIANISDTYRKAEERSRARMSYVRSDKNPEDKDGIRLGTTTNGNEFFTSCTLEIINRGDAVVEFNGVQIPVNQSFELVGTNNDSFKNLRLQCNTEFDFSDFKFKNAAYDLLFKEYGGGSRGDFDGRQTLIRLQFYYGPSDSRKFTGVENGEQEPRFNLFTEYRDVERRKLKNNGSCKSSGGWDFWQRGNVRIAGIYLQGPMSRHFFEARGLNAVCGSVGRGDGTSIAWE